MRMFARAAGQAPEPAAEPEGPPKPEARAEHLVAAIRNGQEDLSEFQGHLIKGDVNLQGRTYHPRLTIRNITFEGHVSLFEAELGRSVPIWPAANSAAA